MGLAIAHLTDSVIFRVEVLAESGEELGPVLHAALGRDCSDEDTNGSPD